MSSRARMTAAMIPSQTGQPPLSALTRRSLFGLAGGTLAIAAAPLSAQLASGFTHGVASGEPGADRVLLWTRFVAEAETRLAMEVSDTLDFARARAVGEAVASPDRDWCAKAFAGGLEAGRWYYYRFVAPDGRMSEIGRTRTLPTGPTGRWRMAVFSCSNIGFGWFNAYAHAAAADDFDCAVHTGDYFYEYGRGTYPSADQALGGRDFLPAGETVALADYRLRHAAYRSDPDLRRLHQLYPMISVWDDHESANDSWRGGAENHQPDTEGEWDVRKRAAMRAYREWLPVSDDPWASYQVGDLATLYRLETRLEARAKPLDLATVLAGKSSPEDVAGALARFRETDYADPSRELMGAAQQAWLARGMQQSKAAGTRWQVLAQQVIMGHLSAPPDLLSAYAALLPDAYKARVQAGVAASRAGLPFNMDAWDGYPAARERLLKAALEAEAELVVLAGDSHNAWAFDLDLDGAPAGVEFAGHSVTSPGAETYLPGLPADQFARAAVDRNDQLKWADTSQRGYMAVELTPQHAACEWRFMGTVRERSTQLAGTHRMVAPAGARRFET